MNATRKEKNEQVAAARVEAIMADTRFAALRTRPARLALAVTMTALIVIIPLVFAFLGSIPRHRRCAGGNRHLVRCCAGRCASSPTFPRSTSTSVRGTLRNRLYVDAYRWFGALVLLLASAGLVAFIVFGEDPDTWHVALSFNGVMAIFWMLYASALSIPSIVLAVKDRELPR